MITNHKQIRAFGLWSLRGRYHWALFWFLVLAVSIDHANAAPAIYAQNPLVTPAAVIVSQNGVKSYRRADHALSWHALKERHTFDAVAVDGKLLVGTSSGLYALDEGSGATIWHILPNATIFSPTVANGVAYAGSRDGNMRAIDLDTGSTIWSVHMDGWLYPPALVDGILITGGSGAKLHAFDHATGELLWTRPLGQELVYRPVPAGSDSAIVTTYAGDVSRIAAATGRTIWTKRDPVASFPPLLGTHHAVFPGWDGNLRARSIRNGALTWSHDTAGPLPFPPTQNEHEIVFAEPSGRAIGIALDNGQTVWRANRAELTLAISPVFVEDQLIIITKGGPQFAPQTRENNPHEQEL